MRQPNAKTSHPDPDFLPSRSGLECLGRLIRWLRPEYQVPEQTPEQSELATGDKDAATASCHPGLDLEPSTKKEPWPKTLQAQIRAVRDQLETAPMDAAALAANFKRKPEKSVTQVLDALTELGMVKQADNKTFRLRDN